MSKKTLGQVAFEAFDGTPDFWDQLSTIQHDAWERAAQAVKDEIARGHHMPSVIGHWKDRGAVEERERLAQLVDDGQCDVGLDPWSAEKLAAWLRAGGEGKS